jgi:5S rRNA maturation endonuclease (ribonuclease M5)
MTQLTLKIKKKSKINGHDYLTRYAQERGLTRDVLAMYDVTARPHNGNGRLEGVYKYCTLDGNKQYIKIRTPDKDFRIEPAKCEQIFYGLQFVNTKLPDLYIVEGEDDCHAMRVYGFENVVSVPNGAGTSDNFIRENGEWFNRFENIYLLFDNDAAGTELARRFADAGVKGDYYRLPKKDARDCLIADIPRDALLAKKAPLPIELKLGKEKKKDPSTLTTNFLEGVDCKPEAANGETQYKACPFCDDDRWHLYVNHGKSVFRCMKCGSAGKLIHPLPTDNEAAKDIRARLCKVYQIKGLSATERHRDIGQCVVGWLHERGEYYHEQSKNFASVYFFDKTRKILFPVQADEFCGWLSDVLGMNREELPFKYVQSAVETEGLSVRATLIEPAVCWSAHDGRYYLSCGPGSMVRVGPEMVEMVDNGTDGVLFRQCDTLPEWQLTAPRNPFECCSLFRDMSTTATMHTLFQVWACLLPSTLSTKPLLVVTGAIGSGKTLGARGVFQLYGMREIISIIKEREGEKDFWAVVNRNGLVCFDNCDTRSRWFADSLAAAATAGTLDARKLYTNSDTAAQRSRAWIVITSANPTFGEDPALADRSLVVRLERRNKTIDDAALMREIVDNRNAGLSWVCNTLATALADNRPIPDGLNKRHPGFAALAVRIGRALGREKDVVAALRAAESDKSVFNLENDPIGAALIELCAEKPFRGTSSKLRNELFRIDSTILTRFTNSTFGKRLAKLWPHLEEVFQATQVGVGSNTKVYQFNRILR